MTETSIVNISQRDILELKKISEETFVEAFADQNTAENIKAYTNKAFNVDSLTAELDNSHSLFFFIKDEAEEVLGYLKLNEFDAQTDLKEQDGLEVERIYVYAKHHGKGIGKQLMEFAMQYAASKNKKYIWLGVWEHNEKAIGFYTKLGFERFDEHAFYLGDERQIDWLMRLDL